jgi:hypothetical protein
MLAYRIYVARSSSITPPVQAERRRQIERRGVDYCAVLTWRMVNLRPPGMIMLPPEADAAANCKHQHKRQSIGQVLIIQKN